MINKKVYLYFLVLLTGLATFQAQGNDECDCQIVHYDEDGIKKIRFKKDKNAHENYLYAAYVPVFSQFENFDQLVKLLEKMQSDPNGTESSYRAPPKGFELIIISSKVSLDNSEHDLMRPYHVSPVDNFSYIRTNANDNQGSKGATEYERRLPNRLIPKKIKPFIKDKDICKISN